MTTIRSLVTDAFRENNLISVGDVPDGASYLEAEGKLTRFITSLFGWELGEQVKNVSFESSSQVLEPNSRIIYSVDTPESVTLSDHPNDGERFAVIDPKGLLSSFTVTAGKGTIEFADEVELTTADINRQWFYRADMANWYRVTDLTSDDESPLPEEFDDYLSQWLAVRIASRTGSAMTGESLQIMNRIKKMFSARYTQKQPVQTELALLRLNSLRTHGYITDWEG